MGERYQPRQSSQDCPISSIHAKIYQFATHRLQSIEHAIELTPNARMLWVYEFIRAEALIHLGRFDAAHIVRRPMVAGSRSMNLSNAVAVAVFEAWRQHDYSGARDT